MGIPEENIKKLTNLTDKDFKKLMRETVKKLSGIQREEQKAFMMVYVAGHGAMDTMQHFVLNDGTKFTVNIEEKLRMIA